MLARCAEGGGARCAPRAILTPSYIGKEPTLVIRMTKVKETKNYARYTPEGTDLVPGDLYVKLGSLGGDEMPAAITVAVEAAQ